MKTKRWSRERFEAEKEDFIQGRARTDYIQACALKDADADAAALRGLVRELREALVQPYGAFLRCGICGKTLDRDNAHSPGCAIARADAVLAGEPGEQRRREPAEARSAAPDALVEAPWPLPDIIERLCEATEHLLNVHDCDAHGWENWGVVVKAGRNWLAALADPEKPQEDGKEER